MGMIGNTLAQGLISGANIQDGTVDTPDIKDAAVTPAKLSTGAPTWTSGGNVGIGTSSPAVKLHVKLGGSSDGVIAESSSNDDFIKFRHDGSLAIVEASYISTGGYTPLTFKTSGSERMRIDTSGNLGLGVTPSAWNGFTGFQVGALGGLNIGGSIDDSFVGSNVYYNAGFKFARATTATYATMYRQTNGVHSWQVSSATGTAGNAISFTQAMTLDASGRLLVGTTNAYSNQFIAAMSSGAGTPFVSINQTGDNPYVEMQRWSGSASDYLGTRIKNSGGVISFETSNSTAIGSQTFSERMRIDSSGNVGIGASSPNAPLQVVGSNLSNGVFKIGEVSNTTGKQLLMGVTTTGNGYAWMQSVYQGSAYTDLVLQKDGGNLLVGTTSSLNSNALVSIKGTASTPLWVQGASQGYTQGAVVIASDTANSPSGRGLGTYMWNQGTTATWFNGTVYGDGDAWYVTRTTAAGFAEGSAQTSNMKMKLTSSGVAYQGNNSSAWTTTSDIRLKESIRGISNALEKITSLNPCHFEYKFALGKTKTGFIAQEFEQVFPGHVHTDKATPDLEEYVGEGGDVKSIDADLTPYLVAAIQEQQAIIESMAQRITALEAA